jgi:hypothetical protein
MIAEPVSRLVNSPKNDLPECIEPIAAEESSRPVDSDTLVAPKPRRRRKAPPDAQEEPGLFSPRE